MFDLTPYQRPRHNEKLTLYLTPHEAAELSSVAESKGMSKNEFLRALCRCYKEQAQAPAPPTPAPQAPAPPTPAPQAPAPPTPAPDTEHPWM
jgi:hypothetical protein